MIRDRDSVRPVVLVVASASDVADLTATTGEIRDATRDVFGEYQPGAAL